MTKNSVYEDDSIRCVTGETLRPGGFFLTERAISLCNINKKGIKALDIGCGMGATVNYLQTELGIEAFGIDPSEKLLKLGRDRYDLSLVKGEGECIPYEGNFFDLVFTECTLSLMEDHRKTIKEAYRVLKPHGYFIISDVFAKRPEYIEDLKRTEVRSCLRNLFDLDILSVEMGDAEFKILFLEDWSSLLKKLMVEIIFKYGSMKEFWNITTCGNCDDFREKLGLCKPGYFLMIGQKGA
jgi:arsenite methyltransferase